MSEQTSAEIIVETNYVEQQSDIESNQFVFSYQITIKNHSDAEFQLISRHWIIEDNNGKVEEVFGDGVVGEQPVIQPNESYTYSSGAVLETDFGTMQGSYFMLDQNQQQFEVSIPKFVLTVPRVLH